MIEEIVWHDPDEIEIGVGDLVLLELDYDDVRPGYCTIIGGVRVYLLASKIARVQPAHVAAWPKGVK